MSYPIHLAEEAADIRRCYPVMAQLRPHLTEEAFVAQVQRQFAEGYRLAYLTEEGEVRAVAGFRLQEMLSRGRFLYVDDLITDGESRSRGHGAALFAWLVKYARAHDCPHLDLDSGVQRYDAHRFYFRERMTIRSYHFGLDL